MRNPKAVLISDCHYTVGTLDLAQAAMQQALALAEELGVPLVDCGDIMDSKAIVRAEVANVLIDQFSKTKVAVYLIVGNHTLLNERSSSHSLNFLSPYATIIDTPRYLTELGVYACPYTHDRTSLQAFLATIPKGSTLLLHTGVQTAFMGHYVQDKSSLPKEAFKDYRVISGHYHRAQDIRCGTPARGYEASNVGVFSYVGNPYTLSFGEANDGPKGFKVLYDDGSLEAVPTNLRKHVIVEAEYVGDTLVHTGTGHLNPQDIIWLKLKGRQRNLDLVNKAVLGQKLFGTGDYKLDLIPTDTAPTAEEKTADISDADLFDSIIDSTDSSDKEKLSLKQLWRNLV